MNDKLLSAISLCRKAGKLKMGMDVVKEAVAGGETRLVLLAQDIAERSERQIVEACAAKHVRVQKLPVDMDELGQFTGKRYGILAICDKGFTQMIGKLIDPISQE